MIGNLLRVTRSELEDYLKDSLLLEDKIFDDETETENLTDIKRFSKYINCRVLRKLTC
ncbi:YfbM family protein [Epilithonimonas sp. JDS]|uniref:YfbM family protein n=1 Tax=Epilithonimonas sp. JDS TaxID=2902797 RepID=UPI001E51B473|nr:YfbM family protein [Epilithonimonas sp. JDS]MCD9854571.1 YfbM family protein [Epilithonimonas sp. JDS]